MDTETLSKREEAILRDSWNPWFEEVIGESLNLSPALCGSCDDQKYGIAFFCRNLTVDAIKSVLSLENAVLITIENGEAKFLATKSENFRGYFPFGGKEEELY